MTTHITSPRHLPAEVSPPQSSLLPAAFLWREIQLLCCENAAVDGIIAIIAQNSRRRKQYMPNAASVALSAESAPASYPVEVSVGGATVFVTDIERFEKL